MFRSNTIVELARLTCAVGIFSVFPYSGLAQLPPLHAAARAQNVKALEHLIASGADVNAYDEAGGTPLITAVLSGNPRITELLLERGAQPDVRQQRTQATALLYAISTRKIELVNILLRAGAHPDLKLADGQTVLHTAAAKDEGDVIEALLSAKADIEARDANGRTPLDEAISHGGGQAVSVLLRHGVDVREDFVTDRRGPLHKACQRGYAAIASALIEAGADPAAVDISGQTPLDLALAYKNGNVVAALLRLAPQHPDLRTSFERAMESATRRGRTAVVRMLLDAGWDVNLETAEGSTYLHEAAFKGHAKVVGLLLDRGAPVDDRDSQGETPLHDAAISGDIETIVVLLDRGAAIDSKDAESGATPLMLAASLGRTEAVALLLKRGANFAAADRSGRTALTRAQEGQDVDLVKLLQAAGKNTAPSHTS